MLRRRHVGQRVLLGRRVAAEAVGTALLVLAVVGSGIAASGLSTDASLTLFENAAATAGALVAIILAVGPVSGAHLNPVVTLADRLFGGLSTAEAGAYCAAQVAGGAVGAVVANIMFYLPAVELSTHARSSGALWTSEVVASPAVAEVWVRASTVAHQALVKVLSGYAIALSPRATARSHSTSARSSPYRAGQPEKGL